MCLENCWWYPLGGRGSPGKLSLNIRAFSLSTPGDLFKGREEMIRCTSSQVTALKLKSSLVCMVKGGPSCSVITMLCSSASRATDSEAFLPTEITLFDEPGDTEVNILPIIFYVPWKLMETEEGIHVRNVYTKPRCWNRDWIQCCVIGRPDWT